MKRKRIEKYQVKHQNTSGGPKFTSLTEALAYIRYCIKQENNQVMTLIKL